MGCASPQAWKCWLHQIRFLAWIFECPLPTWWAWWFKQMQMQKICAAISARLSFCRSSYWRLAGMAFCCEAFPLPEEASLFVAQGCWAQQEDDLEEKKRSTQMGQAASQLEDFVWGYWAGSRFWFRFWTQERGVFQIASTWCYQVGGHLGPVCGVSYEHWIWYVCVCTVLLQKEA